MAIPLESQPGKGGQPQVLPEGWTGIGRGLYPDVGAAPMATEFAPTEPPVKTTSQLFLEVNALAPHTGTMEKLDFTTHTLGKKLKSNGVSPRPLNLTGLDRTDVRVRTDYLGNGVHTFTLTDTRTHADSDGSEEDDERSLIFHYNPVTYEATAVHMRAHGMHFEVSKDVIEDPAEEFRKILEAVSRDLTAVREAFGRGKRVDKDNFMKKLSTLPGDVNEKATLFLRKINEFIEEEDSAVAVYAEGEPTDPQVLDLVTNIDLTHRDASKIVLGGKFPLSVDARLIIPIHGGQRREDAAVLQVVWQDGVTINLRQAKTPLVTPEDEFESFVEHGAVQAYHEEKSLTLVAVKEREDPVPSMLRAA